MTRIGVVGVGRMGSEMARTFLEAGHEVHVYDVDQDQVEMLESEGATGAASAGELAGAAETVVTSLPRAEVVEDVYLGDDGVLAALEEGGLAVEMSTVPPATVEAVAAAGSDHGVTVVDAPVAGPPSYIAEGELLAFVGASEEGFERAEPLLSTMAKRVEHVGDVGRGKAMKLVNNVITLGTWGVTAEAFALADGLGFDVAEAFDVISDGAAQSTVADIKMPKTVAGDYEPGFTVDDARKDLNYALEMVYGMDGFSPVTAAIAEEFNLCSAAGIGDRDYAAMVEALGNVEGSSEGL